MLQESSSSHNIPHVALPNSASNSFNTDGGAKLHHNYPPSTPQHQPTTLSYSVSNSSDLCSVSPTPSASTPQLKKKFSSAENAAAIGSGPCKRGEGYSGANMSTKHQSFDYVGGGSGVNKGNAFLVYFSSI